jgi:SAM-dependent methyltransferase
MVTYDRYAAVYDASGQVRFALLVAVYLEDILARHPVPGSRAVDLACGTGTLAFQLVDAGWQVIGIDAAPAMLAQARARGADAATSSCPYFVEGDMRDAASLLPPSSADLVTCTYDSLNYLLTVEDLAGCFAAVAQILAPGGLFVCDMNTPYFLAYEWGECSVQELPGYVQVEQTVFDDQTWISTMHLTGFVGDDQQGYARFDEVHIERGYSADTVHAQLAGAGLVVEAEYESFTLDPPGPETQRIFWVARKPFGEQRSMR